MLLAKSSPLPEALTAGSSDYRSVAVGYGLWTEYSQRAEALGGTAGYLATATFTTSANPGARIRHR